MRLVFLDSGPLGLLAHPLGRPLADRCRLWARDLSAAGVRVFVPEIADYEVRRELLRLGKAASVLRLDHVKATLDYAHLTTDAMLRAAELWAAARRAGRPTSAPDALDGDCILAAQALLAAGPGDAVIVATGNVGHLGQFVTCLPWDQVVP
jgi:predicted nucleic acid-binding protein